MEKKNSTLETRNETLEKENAYLKSSVSRHENKLYERDEELVSKIKSSLIRIHDATFDLATIVGADASDDDFELFKRLGFYGTTEDLDGEYIKEEAEKLYISYAEEAAAAKKKKRVVVCEADHDKKKKSKSTNSSDSTSSSSSSDDDDEKKKEWRKCGSKNWGKVSVLESRLLERNQRLAGEVFFLLGFVVLLHVETNVVFVWLGTATTK